MSANMQDKKETLSKKALTVWAEFSLPGKVLLALTGISLLLSLVALASGSTRLAVAAIIAALVVVMLCCFLPAADDAWRRRHR